MCECLCHVRPVFLFYFSSHVSAREFFSFHVHHTHLMSLFLNLELAKTSPKEETKKSHTLFFLCVQEKETDTHKTRFWWCYIYIIWLLYRRSFVFQTISTKFHFQRFFTCFFFFGAFYFILPVIQQKKQNTLNSSSLFYISFNWHCFFHFFYFSDEPPWKVVL